MVSWKKNRKKSDLIEKMQAFDYVESCTTTEELSEVYNRYCSFFTEFKKDLDQVIGTSNQIEGLVDNIVEASAGVRNATGFIAHGAEMQAEDAEECRSIVSYFSDRMNTMEEMSQQLVDMAYQMGDENARGKEAVQYLIENQRQNQQVINSITDEIRAVMDKMNRITHVTKVLYTIASQTNLLALNASIEAARAGEAGKGFAVVAEEVRSLSEESRAASEGINKSIQDIATELNGLNDILVASEEIFSHQTEAVGKVTDAMESLNEKVDGFISQQKVFDTQVHALGGEKDKMMASIDNISAMVEKFSATTEEVASLSMAQENKASLLTKTSRTLCKYVGSMEEGTKFVKTSYVSAPKKKVAVICDVDSPFWQPVKSEAHKTAKIFDYEVAVCAPKNRDVEEINKFLEKIIDEKYDAMVISVVKNERLYQLVQKAAGNGMKIVFLQAKVPQVSYEAIIGTDAIQCGTTSAESAIKLLGANGGKVGLGLWSDVKLDTMEKRASGFADRIQKESNIQLCTFDILSTPTQEMADELIEQMLQKEPDIDLFYATNFGWGMHYASYLERHPGRFKLVVVDFAKETEAYIRKDIINCAVAQRQALWGSMPMEILADAFEGKKGREEFIDTGTYEINKSNIDIFVN